jgi:hypothetical protein
VSVAKSCSAALSAGGALWSATSQAGTLTTLYSFENVDSTPFDGASPVNGFFADGANNLFGSTSAGGTSGNPGGQTGYGTAYEAGSVNGTTIASYIQSCNLTGAFGYGTPMGDLAGLSSSSGKRSKRSVGETHVFWSVANRRAGVTLRVTRATSVIPARPQSARWDRQSFRAGKGPARHAGDTTKTANRRRARHIRALQD